MTPPSRSVITSQEAAERAKEFAALQREAVFAFIKQQGAAGATQKEISEALSLGRPSVCARCWELAGGNGRTPHRVRIVATTRRRQGCQVYIALREASWSGDGETAHGQA